MRTLLLLVLLLCSSIGGGMAQGAEPKTAPAPDWKVSGWEVTTCCCQDICPCRFNEKPTHMECEAITAVHLDRGHFGKTRLDNVNFILVGMGLIADESKGKGWNKLYIDETATPEQRDAVLGLLTSIISTYKPEVAAKVFGAESRGMETAAMTFAKSNGGLVREVNAPGVCKVRARLGQVPGSKTPTHILGVLTVFSPVFYPAAEVDSRVDTAKVPFEHPVHHRAEVEDFTLTRASLLKHRSGFQLYDGRGACLLPRN